ncbi:hypothetical protein Acr_10g0003470 [Actinidia rufa]|uniref:Uncharacterized protein n=1 Tax=Actinidia rufa TaxID=165716 RepID=A0A7J0F8D8_9ERIC|nr:hypothetical protein Acr_10g0003470 [Actinidia rufa]
MSLKGRGQGVDLGTSTLSLMRSIFFSFFGLALPYDPLNLFPLFVFLSPRPHTIGNPVAAASGNSDVNAGDEVAADEDGDENGDEEDSDEIAAVRSAIITLLATAPHHCNIAISGH